MCVLLKVQKQLQAGALKLKHKLHNIFSMNIIILCLSCNFFKCPAKMSRVSCIDFYSGWQVWGMCNGRSAQHESGAASSNWLFRLFSRHISRTQSFQQNRHIHFHALVALKLLVSLISFPVARSPRIVVDKQTNRHDKHTDQVL